jgi:Uma2 family endonuclease
MAAPPSSPVREEPLPLLPPEEWPSVEHLVTEDDTPVDSVYSEKQMRLLTRPLYSSWSGPADDKLFLALANVGMFFALEQPPLVPDVLLSLGVKVPADIRPKRHRSYFFWEFGKPPDVVIEVVSNQEGGELTAKKDKYAQTGIPLYVVWDPLALLSTMPLQAFGLRIRTYEAVSPTWFEGVGLGLQIWHGLFEQLEADWLRWCDEKGELIPLGEERAEQERERADKAEQRAARLEAQLRQLGTDPTNGEEP